MADKLRIGVLFGGQSGEHEVSLTSARAVMAALDHDRYDVVPIGITKDGRWLAGGDPLAALEAAADPLLLPASSEARKGQDTADTTSTDAGQQRRTMQFSMLNAQSSIDVIFPVLHGPMGEDGTVQGLLELAGLPYVGCGVLASSVGMDKAMMKAAFAAVGLPQVPWLLVRRVDWRRDAEPVIEQIEASLRYPIFVKLGQSRQQRRRQQGHRPGSRCARASTPPPATIGGSSSSRASTPARSRSACWATTTRRPACRARSCRRTSGTTMMPSISAASRAS